MKELTTMTEYRYDATRHSPVVDPVVVSIPEPVVAAEDEADEQTTAEQDTDEQTEGGKRKDGKQPIRAD